MNPFVSQIVVNVFSRKADSPAVPKEVPGKASAGLPEAMNMSTHGPKASMLALKKRF